MLSAVSASKQKRSREISTAEPRPTDRLTSAPSAISSARTAQSSVSIGFTRVAVRAKTVRIGPSAVTSMSWAWIAWVTRQPPSSVRHRPRQGTA